MRDIMFIGREKEMLLLQNIYKSTKFEFGIVHGRRRVGKTTLLKNSILGRNAIYLLAQQANAKINLELFSKVYGNYKGIGQVIFESFTDLFSTLLKEENLIIIVDEFTYLTTVEPSMESALQGLIDGCKENSTAKLIISGSEVGMFENLFAHSKPLFGRHTFSLHLKECDYLESSLYYPGFSVEDKIRIYAIFGGLPYYLAQIDDSKSIKANVCSLVLNDNAPLANEAHMLLHTELRSIQEYQGVLQAIHSGSTRLSQIDTKSRINDTAKTSKYVNKLVNLEIVEKEIRFLENINSKKHLYRIKNNFIAFYYRFIWKNLSSKTIMDPGDFYEIFISPELEHFVSSRFEKICEQFLVNSFKLRMDEVIINIGRYWYNDRKQEKDIEIDQCVKTRKHIYAYECKWTNKQIDSGIMDGLKGKGTEVKADRYGAFSKNGFDEAIKNGHYDLFDVHDLFYYKKL